MLTHKQLVYKPNGKMEYLFSSRHDEKVTLFCVAEGEIDVELGGKYMQEFPHALLLITSCLRRILSNIALHLWR